MKIRKFIISDLKQLSQIFDGYRVFYEMESDLIEAEVFLKKRIENEECVIFVAENGKEDLVGFVLLYPIFSSTRMKKLWLLNDLFVIGNSRGKGISILLIEQAKIFCIDTKACGLILETAKSNVIGNKLYPKTGFTLDTEHNYYSWDNPS